MNLRYIILSSLVFLGSCSLIGQESAKDFSGLYQAHVSSQIKTIREYAQDLGYMESYEVVGSMKALFALPGLFSGSLSTDYSLHSDNGRDSESTLKNIAIDYTNLGESGSIRTSELGFVSHAGDLFLKYSGLISSNLDATPEIAPIIKKYENTWLALSETALMTSLSGASESDILIQKISESIMKLSLKDIESYMTKYPLWKETKDLGMIGDRQSYEVILHKENILALISTFVMESTGSGLIEADKKSIEDTLAQIDMKGRISYDTKDAHFALFDAIITPLGGSGSTIEITMSESASGFSSKISRGTSEVQLTYTKGEPMSHIVLEVKDEGKELVKADMRMTRDSKKLTLLESTLEAPSQGMTVTLMHKNNPDQSFEGKIDGGIGNITWKGTVDTTSLTDLDITGAMAGASLSLDLKPGTDGLLKGPIIVKYGDEEALRADVGLRISKGRFTLILDKPMTEDPTYATRAEIDILGKVSRWSGKVSAPIGAVPIKTMTDEIESISSMKQEFTEIGANKPNSTIMSGSAR